MWMEKSNGCEVLLATCPALTVCPWQVLSTDPSAKLVYHLLHRAYNNCDSIGSDLLRHQNRNMVAVLAHGNTNHFSDYCLAVNSVFKILGSFSSRNSSSKEVNPRNLLCTGKVEAIPCTVSFVMTVFLQEKAQIRREERAKRRQRLEDINTLKSMGYSERAAQVALHYAQGNLDQAFKVRFSGVVLLYRRKKCSFRIA